jgi:hypothetical protein
VSVDFRGLALRRALVDHGLGHLPECVKNELQVAY